MSFRQPLSSGFGRCSYARGTTAQSETLAALTLYRALDMPYWAQQAERQLTQEVSS
jgi:hypothetical protein